MAQLEHFSPDTLPRLQGFSQAVKVGGPLAFLSGQAPCDADHPIVGEGDFVAQIEQVFHNLQAAVEAVGAGMADVVKLTYYCVHSVDMASLPVVLTIAERCFGTARPPASTWIFVSGLIHPGWLIEVDAVVAC